MTNPIEKDMDHEPSRIVAVCDVCGKTFVWVPRLNGPCFPPCKGRLRKMPEDSEDGRGMRIAQKNEE